MKLKTLHPVTPTTPAVHSWTVTTCPRLVEIPTDLPAVDFLVRARLAEDHIDAQVLLYAGCVKLNERSANAHDVIEAGDLVSRAPLREPANTIWNGPGIERVLAANAH